MTKSYFLTNGMRLIPMAVFSTSFQQKSMFISIMKLSFMKVKRIPGFYNTSHKSKPSIQAFCVAKREKKKKINNFSRTNLKPDRE